MTDKRVVLIEWEDAVFSVDGGDLDKSVTSQTVGFFLSASPAFVELCMEFDAFNNPCGTQRIPTGVVLRITDLLPVEG